MSAADGHVAWEQECSAFGWSKATAMSYPNKGYWYGTPQRCPECYDFFTSRVTPAIGAAEAATFYNNVIIFSGSSVECSAHNYAHGSMGAWGGPAGSSYSFCRMAPGGTPCTSGANPHGSAPGGEWCDPVMKYHVYVCDTS